MREERDSIEGEGPMKHNRTIDIIVLVLLLIGGICWGLIGLFDFDLIGSVFGMTLARVIFVVIGLAAVWRVICWCQCKAGKGK